MAIEFKGMSRDNFLDGLVIKSGMNGRELYDYLIELIDKNPVQKEKEYLNYPTKDGAEFYGNLQELREYLQLRGGSEKMVKFLGACAPDFAAAVVAGELGMEWFAWLRPIKLLDGTTKTWCFYGAYNPASGKWDKFSDCSEEDWKKFLDKKSLLI